MLRLISRLLVRAVLLLSALKRNDATGSKENAENADLTLERDRDKGCENAGKVVAVRVYDIQMREKGIKTDV